jgi:hypothetical protein
MSHRRIACLLALGLSSLVLASCYAETEPATNVLDDGVTLNASVSWQQGDAGRYWFEYRPSLTSPAWVQTTQRSFGPMPGNGGPITISEHLRTDCVDAPSPCTQVTPSGSGKLLKPQTSYEYRMCGTLTQSANPSIPTPITRCWDTDGDQAGDPPPPESFDAFTTLPAWTDVQHDEPQVCPTSTTTEDGLACYDPGSSSALAPGDFTFHKSNTAKLMTIKPGIPPVVIVHGRFQHGRDLAFNGSRADISQSFNYIDGPPLRYAVRMKVYRGSGHTTVADSFEKTVPSAPSFSIGSIGSGKWPVIHHRLGPYHVHFRLVVRASGLPNPNSVDGTWPLRPQTITPEYECPLDADGERICRFIN